MLNFCIGDDRTNQHFGIIVYGELFLRLHNHIADLLKQINPNWTDEILYLEARRIVGALNQIFVYRDYLPLLLGNLIFINYVIRLIQYCTSL